MVEKHIIHFMKLPEKITEAEEDLEEFTLGGNYKNRLLRLWDKFGLNIDNPVESTKYTLLSYGGGPGSILGIGRTKIKFATLNDGITPARTGLNRRDPYGDPKSKVNYGNTSPNNSISYAASSIYGYGQNENSVFYKALNRGIATPTEYFGDTDYLSRLEDTSYLVEGNSNYLQKGWASIASGTDPTEIKLNPSGIPISSKQYSTWDEFFFSIQPKNLEKKTLEDFRTRLKTQEGYTFLSLSPDYTTKNIETRLNLGKRSGGPGVSGRRIDYTIGKRDAFGNFLGPVDTINAFPIYRSKIDEQPSSDLINDIIPFKISILDNNDPNKLFHVHLRAFIDDFSDGYKASWKKIEYMGRGEKFFKYSGFDRDISFGFTVAAQSKEELIPIYKKLNFLASSLSPFYTDNGYMAGNISYITLGDYLINQPGIIESMNIDVEKESPWEIGIGIDGNRDPNAPRLPFIVKVKMKFTPIHSFRPEIQNITGMQTYSNITEDTIYPDSSKFGTQRYISTIPSDNPLYNKVSRTDSPIADSSPIDQQEFWINLPEDQRNPFEILVGDESTFYYNTMQPSQPGIIQSPPTQTPFPENVIFPQPPNPVTVP